MDHKLLIIILLQVVIIFNVFSQSPSSSFAWLETEKVKTMIRPTGIHRIASGGFYIHNSVPGKPDITLLTHLAPWAGGVDPGFNINTVCETQNITISDWQAGFRVAPNSGKVWKVTREQVEAHLSDFMDNGVIDNPIPEIFAWPGKGNPFSMDYNGFSMDSLDTEIEAPFREPVSVDGIYNPDKGDFPELYLNEWPLTFASMTYSPFFDNGQHLLTNSDGYFLDGSLLAYTLNCNQQDFIKNTVFLEYKYYNRHVNRLDSLNLGVFADFNIGDGNDDYLGCDLEEGKEMVYCYNSDTLTNYNTEDYQPAIGLMLLNSGNGIFGWDGPKSYFMPIFQSGNFPPGALEPQAFPEYYNYLTSTWRDGTPLTRGGYGYNPGSLLPPLKAAFPDNPSDPNGWSELSANNIKTNRYCVVSQGPFQLKPHNSRVIKFALTAADKKSLSAQLKQLKEMRALQGLVFDNCWDCPNWLDSLCMTSLLVHAAADKSTIFPNPTSGDCLLFTQSVVTGNITVFNESGQEVRTLISPFESGNGIKVSLRNLPKGYYFLRWNDRSGKTCHSRVLKE